MSTFLYYNTSLYYKETQELLLSELFPDTEAAGSALIGWNFPQ